MWVPFSWLITKSVSLIIFGKLQHAVYTRNNSYTPLMFYMVQGLKDHPVMCDFQVLSNFSLFKRLNDVRFHIIGAPACQR